MDRKDFLKISLKTGLICCGAASAMLGQLLTESNAKRNDTQQDWIKKFEKRMIKGAETPSRVRFEKAQNWIKNLMDNMDTLLDDETKIKLMQACGCSCYNRAFGIAPTEKPTTEDAEKVIASLENAGYKVTRENNKTTIIYNWGRTHQNPQGLIMSDGYCLCPIVEDGPPDLSPTYCNCSSGYVKEIFERSIGKAANVKVIESLKMGGNDCIFRIEFEDF